MKTLKPLLFAAAFSLPMLFASCSEEDDTVYEFENWVERNDTYFNNLTDSVNQLIAAGRTDWKRIKAWSKDATAAGDNSDYIIAHVVASGDESGTSPLYTDSVYINYRGRYIPSNTYPQGYVFDETYSDEFDPEVIVPTGMPLAGTVTGFETALLNMKAGDRWIVYIPYNLGYGESDYTTSSSTIPGGSTLIFDLNLVSFFSPRLD